MDDFVLISQVAKETPYSAEYLSLLVRKGRIAGKKFGRNWTISRSALNEYLAGHRVVIAPQQVYKTVLASEPLSPISPLTPISNSQGQTFPLRSEASEGQVREVPRSDLKSEKDLAVEVKKELDELENIYQNKISGGKLSIPLEPLSPPLAEKGEMGMMGEKSDKAKFSFPRISEMGTMGGTGERGKWNKNSYGRNVVQWAEMAIVSILVLGFILGGFNFKFADALYGAFKDLINNAMTLDGHAPGTHANEVLLLDKGGNISINGNVETNGQLKSHVPEGVAPLEVDSRTTVPNLSANFLEGLTAASFDLQLVTGHGAVTSNRVKLGGGAEILNSLLVNAPSVFTEYVSVAKDLFVNGKATIANGLDVMGNSSIIGRLTVKGDVDISNLVAAQRAQIKEGGLTVSGATQLNSLGVTGGASMSDLGISGNFAVAGKEISLGDSGADKLTITASTTFSGGGRFLVGPEATFNKHVGIDSGGLSVIGASSITGASSIIGNTTITGDLSVSGATSFGLNFGVGTSTPGGALGVKGAGLFDGFVSANYFTSTSSLTSWLMGQMGIGTTTPGAEMGVKGGILSEGFVSADYFTSTSTNSNWFNGALGLGTTTPGARLATKGSIISEGFISADYFTSTSTNSSWIFGNLGVGTTTPGAQLAINGTLMALTGTSTLGGLISPSVFSTTSLNFYTNSNSTPRMVIDTIGNVGIGTSSPAVTLGVNGSGLFTNNLTVEGTTDLQGNVTFGSSVTSDSTATSTFNGGISAVGLSSSMGLTLTGGDAIISGTINVDGSGDSYVIGNLGVGTTTPGSKLAIDGDASVDGLYAMGTTTTSSLIATSTIEVRSSAYSAGTLFNTFKEKIGIATSTPGSLLSVHGNANIGELTVEGQLKTGFITATSTTNNTFAGALDVTESATSTFTGGINVSTVGGLSSATGLTITGGDILSSGKLTLTSASTSTIPQLNVSTILTTPILDVSTIIKNSGTATSTFAGGLSLGTGGLNITSGGLYVDSGDVTFDQKLVVSGNVGIGTTTPGNLLAVDGNITVDGLYAMGTTTTSSLIATSTLEVRGTTGNDLITSNGRVGMGSSTPNATLTISNDGSNSTKDLLNIVNSVGSYNFTVTNGGSVGIGMYNPSGYLSVYGNTYLAVTEGNVGIGETSPGAKLSVSGGLAVGSSYDTTTVADGNVIISGNVGIGTTTPAKALQISTTGSAQLMLTDSDAADDLKHWYASSTDGSLSWGSANDRLTSWTERMRIDSSGNVGIGTTTPGSKLAIDGDASVDGLYAMGTTTTSSLIATSTLEVRSSAYTGGLLLAAFKEKVGLGTSTPGSLLSVQGVGNIGELTVEGLFKGGTLTATSSVIAALGSASAPSYTFIGDTNTGVWSAAADTLNISTGGSERVRVTSDGNVGVGGVTSPITAFHVVGQCVTGDTKLRRRRRKKSKKGQTLEPQGRAFPLRSEASEGQVREVPRPDLNRERSDLGDGKNQKTTSFNVALGGLKPVQEPGSSTSYSSISGVKTVSSMPVEILGTVEVTGIEPASPWLTSLDLNQSTPTALLFYHEADAYEYDEVAIKDIQPGDEIQSLNEETGMLVWSKVNALMDMGVKPIFKLTTSTGKTIRTTGNHPYLTKYGWVKVFDLAVGNTIAVAKETEEKSLVAVGGFGLVKQNDNQHHQGHNYSKDVKSRYVEHNNIFGMLRPAFHYNNVANYSNNACNYISHNQVVHDNYIFSILTLIIKNIIEKIAPVTKVVKSMVAVFSGMKNLITADANNILDTSAVYLETESSCSLFNRILSWYDGSTESVKWEKIVSIESLPPEQVYDIEVEGTHNFVAGHYVNTRTGEALTLEQEEVYADIKLLRNLKAETNDTNQKTASFNAVCGDITLQDSPGIVACSHIIANKKAPVEAAKLYLVTSIGAACSAVCPGLPPALSISSLEMESSRPLCKSLGAVEGTGFAPVGSSVATQVRLCAPPTANKLYHDLVTQIIGKYGIVFRGQSLETILHELRTTFYLPAEEAIEFGGIVAHNTYITGDVSAMGGELNIGDNGVGKATSTLSSLGGRLSIYDNSQASTSPGAIFSIHANTTTPAFLLNQAGAGDIFTLQDNGITGLILRDGALLGIATSSPNARFEVAGDGLFKGGLYVQATTTTSSLIATSTLEVRSSAYSAGTVFNVFKEKVGLGTSTPGSLLSVQGNANIGELTVEGQLKTSFITATSTTNSSFAGALDVTESATSTFTGGVNVSTTGGLSSATGLTITGGDILSSGKLTLTGASTSTIPQLNVSTILTTPTLDVSTIIKNSGTATSTFAGGLSLGTGGLNITSGGLYVDVGDATFDQDMYVNGNVGIGTTGPGAKLDIYQADVTGENIYQRLSTNGMTSGESILTEYYSAATVGKFGMEYDGTSVDFVFQDMWNGSAQNNEIMRIKGTGNVGIGTTSPAALTSIGGNLFVGASSAGGTQGNLGIGIASPGDLLHIYSQSAGYSVLEETSYAGATGPGIKLRHSRASHGDIVNADVEGYIVGQGYSGGTLFSGAEIDFAIDGTYTSGQRPPSRLQFFTNVANTAVAERMRIDSGGNVGIGTVSPDAPLAFSTALGDKIQLYDNAGASTYGFGLQSNNLQILTATVATDITFGYGLSASETTLMTIKGGGNVGIGTTSPAALLSVGGDLFVGASTAGGTNGNLGIGTANIEFGFQLDVRGASARSLLRSSTPTNSVFSRYENTNIMYVGIDTSTGGGIISGGLTYSGLISSVNDYSLQFGTNNTARMTIDRGGAVGIGTTTPGGGLSVSFSTATPALLVNQTGTGDLLTLQDGGATAFTVKDGGNVGIGDTDPTEATLVVGAAGAGNIYATFATANTETLCWDASGASLITDCTSLSQFKENVENLSLSGIDTVLRLTPREYDWIGKEDGIKHDLGFVAEEVNAVSPLLASYNYDEQGVLKLNGVKYERMSALFALAIQEMNQRIDLASAPTSTPSMVIDAAGNVGIGSTTPNYKLAVAGDVAATSFINISTKTAKKDITYLSESDEQSVLEKIRNTNVATYEYINDEARSTKHETNSNDLNSNDITKGKSRLGLIAEEAPVEVLSIDGKGVDIYKLSSFILAGVKAQQLQIDQLKTDVALIKSNLQGLTFPLRSEASEGQVGQDQGQTLNLGSAIQDLGYKIIIVAKSTLAELASTIGDWANAALAETTKLIKSGEDETNMTYKTYSVQGSRDEIIASGSAVLKGLTLPDQGQTLIASARIKFDESFVAAISETENIKVILTPTSRLNGALYVHAKSRFGFEVREINATDEGGMFDWMVVARKKGGEDAAIGPISPIGPITPVPVETPVAEATPAPVVEEVAPVPAEEPASTVAEPAPMEEVVPVEEPVAPAPVEEPVTPSAGEPVITPTEEVAPAPAETPPAEEPAP